MENKKLKNDMILVGALIVTAFLLFCVLDAVKKEGKSVRVTVDGEVVARYSLSEDRTERIETEKGYNVLVISDGAASVTEADCKNQICVHTHSVSFAGETITCLPHRLSVTVEGEGIDFVQ